MLCVKVTTKIDLGHRSCWQIYIGLEIVQAVVSYSEGILNALCMEN